ncbi:SGNH/GDSL hydrolase family protein [Aurantibacter crassamenti]|nr:SGNH/GDSL hydrolase family protein [Aurantibacter crassamenti]
MTLNNINIITILLLLFACNVQEEVAPITTVKQEQNSAAKLSYLALGDSYTIGESVSNNKNFPKQLEKTLESTLNSSIKTTIIARTGWRTDNLLEALETADLENSYSFVTLLIGVNNQYQDASFAQYEKEFPELLAKAIALAGNNSKRVAVVSIPDWGFTPFGENRNRQKITSEIDNYNSFAQSKAKDSQVSFVEITDITREGLDKPELVAKDGLHPSAEAYRLFAERIAPIISNGLKD